jgi:transcriptional regulator with XRE-family HTH domain
MKVRFKIKKLANEKGLSMKELAELSGVSFSQLYRIERCEASPSLDTMYLIATALNVEISDLYEIGK